MATLRRIQGSPRNPPKPLPAAYVFALEIAASNGESPVQAGLLS
jgi:hypothetical protein